MSPGFRSLMWYLLYGTRGGPNRLRILKELERHPANAHQLAGTLALDYRTVRHHLRLLEKNGAIARPVGDAYAAPYELSPYLEAHIETLRELESVERRSAGVLRAGSAPRAAGGDR
jgi:DNA-binding transcriptional ArsR family regulator